MLFLATSCLQGRPITRAVLALLALRPDGLQLCPGHTPAASLRPLLDRVDLPLLHHHGFSWTAWRQPVHRADGPLVGGPGWSLHPPGGPGMERWLEARAADGIVVEVMTPGAWLGDGPSLRRAMEAGVALAVDVSHLHVQRQAGVLDDATLARLLDYDRVAEVHVSDNDGTADQHRPLTPRSFGLDWARERGRAGTPIVLECRMHRLDLDTRARQLELCR